MNYVYFVHVRTTPAWLKLDRERRRVLAELHVYQPLEEFSDLKMRYFDAEAFTGRLTDIMMFETLSPESYYFFIERFRDSPLIADAYFEVVDIIPTLEEGFQTYEASLEGTEDK